MAKNSKRIDVSEARKSFADLISEVGYRHDRVILCRNGKEIVAMIPLADLAFLEKLEEQYELSAIKDSMKTGEALGVKEAKARLKIT